MLPILLILVLLGAVSPALAYRPAKTYNVVAIGFILGLRRANHNKHVVFIKGSVGVGDDYGYPWGDGTHVQINHYYLNMRDYTGRLFGTIEKTFNGGTLKMVATCQFTGVGYYTYHGPTITVTTPSGPVELNDGMQFMGLLYTGGATGYITINHHLYTEKMTGVSIVGGALNGAGLVVGTGLYIMIR